MSTPLLMYYAGLPTSIQGVVNNTEIFKSLFSENDYHSNLTISPNYTQEVDKLSISGSTYSEVQFETVTSNEIQNLSVEFNLTNTSTIIELWKKPIVPSFIGLAIVMDLSALKLKAYEWDGTDLGTLKQEIDINIDINTNDTYELSWEFLYQNSVTYTLKNISKANGNSSTINVNHYHVRDKAGFAFVSGGIEFLNIKHFSNTSNPTKYGIIGDSYVDAGSVAFADSWAYKVYQDIPIQYYGFVSGRAGHSSSDINDRLQLSLDSFNPAFVVICCGYNDTILATFETQLGSIIGKIETAGAVPIICTLAPVSGTLNNAIVDDQNTHIKGLGKRLLNIAVVMTIGGDEVTINSSLVLPDNSHPNVQGHSDIYDQAKIDVPEMFL